MKCSDMYHYAGWALHKFEYIHLALWLAGKLKSTIPLKMQALIAVIFGVFCQCMVVVGDDASCEMCMYAVNQVQYGNLPSCHNSLKDIRHSSVRAFRLIELSIKSRVLSFSVQFSAFIHFCFVGARFIISFFLVISICHWFCLAFKLSYPKILRKRSAMWL